MISSYKKPLDWGFLCYRRKRILEAERPWSIVCMSIKISTTSYHHVDGLGGSHTAKIVIEDWQFEYRFLQGFGDSNVVAKAMTWTQIIRFPTLTLPSPSSYKFNEPPRIKDERDGGPGRSVFQTHKTEKRKKEAWKHAVLFMTRFVLMQDDLGAFVGIYYPDTDHYVS